MRTGIWISDRFDLFICHSIITVPTEPFSKTMNNAKTIPLTPLRVSSFILLDVVRGNILTRCLNPELFLTQASQ